MSKNELFNTTSLEEFFQTLNTVNVIDPCSADAAAYLTDRYSGITVTGAELTKEMLQAISDRTVDAFHIKYCEAPFLVVIFDKNDACKSTLQHELAYFMSVRDYKGLKTIILSEERVVSYPLSNESFIGFSRVYTEIRN